MATQVLGGGQSSNGIESVTWQVDYDDVALTVGHTCTGQASILTLSVTLVATGQTFSKDVTGDLNQGRVIDFTNVPNSLVPVHVKGQPYPFLFASSWTP